MPAFWHKPDWQSTLVRGLGRLFAVLLCALLGGCLASKEPVFDPKDAVTPFAPGKYKIARFADGAWVSEENAWPISLGDGSYNYDDPKNGRVTIRLYELDTDAYIVEQGRPDRMLYGIMRVKDGSLLFSYIDCQDYLKSDFATKAQPVEHSRGYVEECFFKDNEQLFAALRELGGSAKTLYRLTPVSEVPEAPPSPRSQVSLQQETTTLTLCNKSPLDINALIHHQHRYDPAKYVLSGWYEVQHGQCRMVGQFPKPQLSVFGVAHGKSGRIEWLGKSKEYCVSLRQVYRVLDDNEKCIPGEAAKRFFEIDTANSAATHNFTYQAN